MGKNRGPIAVISALIIAASGASLAFGVAVANASGDGTQATVPVGGTADEIQLYCSSVVDAVRDRRYLLQKQDLEKLQAGVDDRLKALEKRKAEYEDWLQRRNDFLNKAETNLVDIYKSMKPDAAAARLAAGDMNIAGAILMKLTARQSGLIMSEMDPATVAKLTALISSAADANTSKGQP